MECSKRCESIRLEVYVKYTQYIRMFRSFPREHFLRYEYTYVHRRLYVYISSFLYPINIYFDACIERC